LCFLLAIVIRPLTRFAVDYLSRGEAPCSSEIPLSLMLSILKIVISVLVFTLVAGAEQLVLRDMNVINPADPQPLSPHMDIVIENGRIRSVEPFRKEKSYPNARVLNLSGRYLVPGFVEMHAHLLASPHHPTQNSLLPAPDPSTTAQYLRTLLAFGITTVRDPGDPTGSIVSLKKAVAEGKLTGPTIFAAGSIINTSVPGPEFVRVATADEVCERIRLQRQEGVDFIKLYSSLPPELVAAGIRCAHAQGLKVIGHMQRTTWTEAANLGIDAIAHGVPWSAAYLRPEDRANAPGNIFGRIYWLEHLDLNSEGIQELLGTLNRHHVTIDATLITYHTKFWGNDARYVRSPDLRLAPKQYRDGWRKGSFTADWSDEDYSAAQTQWPKVLAFVRRLYDSGVLLTVGTDSPTPWTIPGVSFHQELLLLHDAGISNLEVLRMATYNGSVSLGKEEEFGSIKNGMRADLVVLTANPLEDLRHTRAIESVIQNGVVHEADELLDRQADQQR
jgi:imidazolonepropionase-like amidohydrolase